MKAPKVVRGAAYAGGRSSITHNRTQPRRIWIARAVSELLDPGARAATDPHPFFIENADQRADVIAFLKSLDDQPLP
jgi:hypothetical protein